MSNLFTLELQGGSSPLARGTLSRHRAQLLKLGLIPARAGNTWCSPARLIWRGAHPRSRGEHTRPMSLNLLSGGSSPLARGTQPRHRLVVEHRGLIPARAGNTLYTSRAGSVVRAHPRSRGEHRSSALQMSSNSGSSPLARGTHRLDRHIPRPKGLIPARAGNTAYPDCAEVSRRAHPRSRGEHFNFEDGQTEKAGSSPLARGTRSHLRRLRLLHGLIPARAGNTSASMRVE